ncbi:FAD:protein FMN transferase [Actinorugispora endophytica]|uniref:FAD:protein FMN transferase n=1 Tax=Actinorugispora endophytica TaxID=1605990 RepID=A0A4R6UAJ6_9ACTN|nr:FAD:protein FMN transferase [Actinorugispora endophytica]TDQ43650.1 thiamine biosynthesis lipoprotein [Actinorugispora endophytica]
MRAFRDRVMGTDVLLAGMGAGEQAAVLGWLREAERVFTRFSPGSDTRRVGAADGRATEVSASFTAALAEACAHHERTGGLFDPFLGAAMERIGYSVGFDEITARGGVSPGPVAPVPPESPGDDAGAVPRVEIDHERGLVTLPPGTAVDLGGFVKGWSVQQAADALRRAGARRGLIDAGGDIVAWRDPADAPWRVGVEHPLRPEPAGTLALAPYAAVATSSTARRRWRDASGAPAHHIVDPRTGRPADSDCVQATVLGRDLGAAEVYATCLVVLGTVEGPALLADLDGSAAWITVDREGRVRSAANLDHYCAEVALDVPP